MRQLFVIGLGLCALLFSNSVYSEEASAAQQRFQSSYQAYLTARQTPTTPTDELQQVAREAWQAGQDYFGENDINTATLLMNYLLSLAPETLQQEQYQQLTAQMITVFRSAYGEDAYEVVAPLLIGVRSVAGKDSAATKGYVQEAETILNQYVNEQPERVIGMRVLFATELLNHGLSEKSRWQKLYQLSAERLGDTHLHTLTAAYNIASHDEADNNHTSAMSTLRRIVNLPESDAPEMLKLRIAAHTSLARIHSKRKEDKEAALHAQSVSRLSVNLGEAKHEPTVIYRTSPSYPTEELQNDKGGAVLLSFAVNEDGGVSDIEVVEQTSEYFGIAAKEALALWRYAPGFVNGEFVRADGLQVQLDFSIEKQSGKRPIFF